MKKQRSIFFRAPAAVLLLSLFVLSLSSCHRSGCPGDITHIEQPVLEEQC